MLVNGRFFREKCQKFVLGHPVATTEEETNVLIGHPVTGYNS